MAEVSVAKVRNKCELCKCLNLIAEGKKHPSQTVWHALTRKYYALRERREKSISSLCETHRHPMNLIADIKSVDGFIQEVLTTIDEYLKRQGV